MLIIKIWKFIIKKIWIIEFVQLVCLALTLIKVSFISNVAQNIYYVIFSILFILTIITIHREYSFRLRHGYLIIVNLLLIWVALLNHFIVLPLILVYPLLYSKKSHWILKILSSLSYVVLLFFIFLILFTTVYFSTTKITKTVNSPNNKYMVQVYSVDEGALGGSTYVTLGRKYFNVLKYEKNIYSGRFGEAQDVKWIDDNVVQIDNKTIKIK